MTSRGMVLGKSRGAGWILKGLGRAVVLVGVMVMACLAQILPASATTVSSTGYPGQAYAPGAASGFSVQDQYGTYHRVLQVPADGAFIVYRSAQYQNYNQYVCVNPQLWRREVSSWDGSVTWRKLLENPYCNWIYAGKTSYTYIGRTSFYADQWDHEDLTIMIGVTWQASNGYLLGQSTYNYAQLNNYRCDNTCQVHSSFGQALLYFFDA